MRCVDLYNQTQSKWFEEMVTTCMVKTLKHDSFHIPENQLWPVFLQPQKFTCQRVHPVCF